MRTLSELMYLYTSMSKKFAIVKLTVEEQVRDIVVLDDLAQVLRSRRVVNDVLVKKASIMNN